MRYRRHEMTTVSAVAVTDNALSVDARLLYVLLCVVAGRGEGDTGDTNDDALMSWLNLPGHMASELYDELLEAGYLTPTTNGYMIEDAADGS